MVLLLPWIMCHFHSEISVHKWKYVFQRRITIVREINKETLDCKEVMKLLG